LALLGRAEFEAVDKAITALLGSLGIGGWDKFYVINDYLVVVRIPSFTYAYCYHRPTAGAILARLEALARYDQYMPGGDDLTPRTLMTCSRRVCERLQKIRRGLELRRPGSHA
jgi:hypothetical protein